MGERVTPRPPYNLSTGHIAENYDESCNCCLYYGFVATTRLFLLILCELTNLSNAKIEDDKQAQNVTVSKTSCTRKRSAP